MIVIIVKCNTSVSSIPNDTREEKKNKACSCCSCLLTQLIQRVHTDQHKTFIRFKAIAKHFTSVKNHQDHMP